MIRYALNCEFEHGFEAWFSSSEDFDVQAARGLVECPFCASRAVRKAIMAPAVKRADAGGSEPAQPALQTLMTEAVDRLRRHVEERCEYVGDAFAREARAIHEGESEARGVWGEATPEEVRALKQDGVPVAPLPPAAVPRPKTDVN